MGDAAAARLHAFDRKRKKAVGRRVAPLRIAGREMRADVALGQRAQDGVDQRMQRHVGVGMADQRAIMRDADAAERDVIAGRRHARRCRCRCARRQERGELHRFGAREIASSLVILMLPGSPANTLTFRPAHSASAASSVKSSRPSRGRAAMGLEQSGKAKPCGVCTSRKLLRSSVLSTMPAASTVLTVSVTGSAGIAAPLCLSVRRDGARDQRRARERPRRVVDEDDIGLA